MLSKRTFGLFALFLPVSSIPTTGLRTEIITRSQHISIGTKSYPVQLPIFVQFVEMQGTIMIQRPTWAVENSIPGKIFDILSRHLSENSDPPATAESLTIVFDDFLSCEDSSFRVNIKYLWGTFLYIAKHLPHDSAQQDRLVEVLREIQKIRPPSGYIPDEQYYSSFKKLWLSLPGFIGALVDFELDAPLVPRLRDRPTYEYFLDHESGPWSQELSAVEWTNISAFCARVHTVSPDLIHLDIRGLSALLDALEENHTAGILDTLVPAAACWIIYAGPATKNNPIEYAMYDDDGGGKRMPWSVGELYHGPKGFNVERWAFWKTRLQALSADDNLKPETRSFAEKAYLEM